jgi:hypothetical protein
MVVRLALQLEALAGAPMAAESAHGADEARSSGKRYFLRGQSLWGEGMLGRAAGLLAQAGIQNLVSLDDTFARTVSAPLRAETAEQAEERVRGALKARS